MNMREDKKPKGWSKPGKPKRAKEEAEDKKPKGWKPKGGEDK
ncbi:hypothetical protein Tco_1050936, partial [Tanacetum coccineum]